MSLKYILEDIAADLGNKLTVTSERDKLIVRVNTAAKKLYDENELEGCLREELFHVNVESNQITLPPRVGQVRGYRYAESGIKGDIVTQQARYHNGDWGRETWSLKFRELEKRSLYREIENETRLKIYVKETPTEAFKIIFNGKNSLSDKVQDIITFTAGSGAPTFYYTVHSYTDVTSVIKEGWSAQNVYIEDADEILLSVIPNYETSLEHVVLQVSDTETAPEDWDGIEILYKMRYIPMLLDYDDFICGATYDDAIVYKYHELFNLKRSKDVEQAQAMKGLVKETLDAVGRNSKLGKRIPINWGAPGVYKVFSSIRGAEPYYK